MYLILITKISFIRYQGGINQDKTYKQLAQETNKTHMFRHEAIIDAIIFYKVLSQISGSIIQTTDRKYVFLLRITIIISFIVHTP